MLPDALDRLLHARRALLPLPLVDRPQRIDANVFPPLERRRVEALRGKSVGVAATGGRGPAVGLVGVARAFEEAGVEPQAIAACSGSVLWGAMWAAGTTAGEMAGLALRWRPERQLGVQWAGLPRFALAAARGYRGLSTGDALEQLFPRNVWHMTAAETSVPFRTAVLNVGSGRVEQFGSEESPDLTLGELARIAVAQPSAAGAVRVEGDLYVDATVADGFATESLLRREDFDHVFGMNGSERPGLAFYDLFLDRRDWPRLMRAGYDDARAALDRFSRRPGTPKRSSKR